MADSFKNQAIHKRRAKGTMAPQSATARNPQTTVGLAVPDGGPGGVSDAAPEPAREEIARLAYSYWEARGGQGGSPEEDWARAESELRSRPRTLAASGGASC
jgi:hypothetical protein